MNHLPFNESFIIFAILYYEVKTESACHQQSLFTYTRTDYNKLIQTKLQK